METIVIQTNTLDEAAALIQKGETVVFPTETVYGLGANALNPDAVLKIFQAKNRPADNPLIVHVSSLSMIEEVSSDFNDMAKTIAKHFMPGPITLVLKKADCIPNVVSAGLSTVGVRFPKHPVARELITKAGTPIAAPSANISGSVSATTFSDVYRDLNGRVGGIVQGDDCEFGIESTVLDVTGEVPVILRPGSVTLEMLQQVIPETRLHPSLVVGTKVNKPASPGMKYTHYSPKADVYLVYGEMRTIISHFETNLKETECLFVFSEEYDSFCKNKMCLGTKTDLSQMAHRMFRLLKQADMDGYQTIYIPAVAEEGIGLSVMNRLKKSSGGKVLSL